MLTSWKTSTVVTQNVPELNAYTEQTYFERCYNYCRMSCIYFSLPFSCIQQSKISFNWYEILFLLKHQLPEGSKCWSKYTFHFGLNKKNEFLSKLQPWKQIASCRAFKQTRHKRRTTANHASVQLNKIRIKHS